MTKKQVKILIDKIALQQLDKNLQPNELENIYYVLCGFLDFDFENINNENVEYAIFTYLSNN